MRYFAHLLMAAVVLAVGTSRADAAFSTVFGGTSPVAGGGTIFNYSLNFAPATGESLSISPFNFVTIYDFGPATNISVPSAFTFSQALLGYQPSGIVNPNDDPNILNITLLYNGPTLATPMIFNLQFTSSSSGTRPGVAFQGNTTSTGAVITASNILVPGPAAVPEPASVVMTGMGSLAVLGLLRWRNTDTE